MIPYPNINPEIVRIGDLGIRWYGLMYLIGFVSSYLLVRHNVKVTNIKLQKDFLEGIYIYIIIGLLVGARLGYIIFYNPLFYLMNPFEIFAIWHGGLSFHGALIGCIIAGMLFCKRYNYDFWQVSDIIIITVPIGLGLGRIGNFINGELYGRITDVKWAMIFPSGGGLPRHPSQLYEAFFEGVVLFIILWIFKGKKLNRGILTSLFIIFYGIFRFLLEFTREPDIQLGFVFKVLTMGQILSLFMIVIGIFIFYNRRKTCFIPP